MLKKKILVATSLLVLTVVVATGCNDSSNTTEKTQETKKQESKNEKLSPFEEWTTAELIWPDWAKPVEVDMDEEIGPGPSIRKTFALKEAQEKIGQLRFLVENSKDTAEFPYHNVWREELGTGLLQLGEYQLAYHFLDEVYNLPDDASYGKDEVDGKEVVQTLKDSKARQIIHGRLLNALSHAGFKDEVKDMYKEYDYNDKANLQSWGLNSAAWAMGIIGDKEEAYNLFEKGLEPETFGEDSPFHAVSNILASSAFAYSHGDYDKTLSFSDKLVENNIDSLAPEYFVGQDLEGKKADYYKNHWKSSYQLVEAYRELAKQAQEGNTVSFEDLKDGVYTSSNIGYMQTPIDVEVTVEGGKVTDIKSSQAEPKDDRSAAAIETLPNRIVKAQSLDVDVVSSATISSESTKLGVAQALLKAKK